MAGLGILLIVLGFGSLILEQMGYEFRLMSWADDYQPGAGIGVGVVGIVVLIATIIVKNKKQSATNVTINNQPPAGQWGPPPQGQPGQYNQPPQGQPGQWGQQPQGQPGQQNQPPQGYNPNQPPPNAPYNQPPQR